MSRTTIVTSAILMIVISAAAILPQTHAGISYQATGRESSLVEPEAATPLFLTVALQGSGATFPAPLVSRWAIEYGAIRPNVTVAYQAVGSGRGINNFINKTHDFGMTDAPLTSGQRILGPNALHLPLTIGSVVPAYNLPGIATGLNFTGDLLARIYLGPSSPNGINVWNDPALQSINPGVVLPSQDITTVRRSDSSGTTFVWTSFLSLSSAEWASVVGSGTTVTWPDPGTVGANGNGGVATFVQNTPYTLGYVELTYALQNAIAFGDVRNPAGTYVRASLQTTQWAVANSSATLPAGDQSWASVSLLNAPGLNSYPIASFSYALVYKELNVMPQMNLVEVVQARELVNFLSWVNGPGQAFASVLSYVPLPSNVASINTASINSIRYNGNAYPFNPPPPTPVTRNLSLTGHAANGWNNAIPGPLISVVSRDTVNLALSSSDGLTHQLYIDLDNDGVLDTTEEWNASPAFTTSTAFTFTPTIWSQTSIPAAGEYTYRCSFHSNMRGAIKVAPQQVGANFKPVSSLTSSLAPTLDNSRVTTIGTLLINMRTLTVTGSIDVVAVDKVSGAVVSTRSYAIPNLPLPADLRLTFIMLSPVLPYDLSSDVQLTLSGFTGSTLRTLTRELDLVRDGIVNILDLASTAIAFGTIPGDTRWNPLADFNADSKTDILDIALIAFYFDATSLL